MAMNWLHRRKCGSERWAEHVADDLLPWALEGVDLGADVLEIGPGYGANLRALLTRGRRLTAVEIDPELAARLERSYGTEATVINADATAIPVPSDGFDSVVCFTMLHHMPTVAEQDKLFAEAYRVLQPGGTFAGSDGVHNLRFRVIHLGDTYNPVSPDTLAQRLTDAGFTDADIGIRDHRIRFRARKASS